MRNALIVSMGLLLGACAFGRTYDYKQFPLELPVGQVAQQPLALAVQDRRPYVVSGAKAESFVGLRRGGFGNPFDMHTTGRVAFADDFRETLAGPLKAKGFQITAVRLSPADSPATVKRKLAASGLRKIVVVTLAEWKTDILRSTDLHYDVTLSVLDEKGVQLASKATKGLDELGPTGREGLERAFARKFAELFEDEKVAAALRDS
jgi:hypothetical protein